MMRLFHYTHIDQLESVMRNGLCSQRIIDYPGIVHKNMGQYLVEAFLEPYPSWAKGNKYWGDLGAALISEQIGDVLLEIDPHPYQVMIEEYAYKLCLNYWQRNGTHPLDLGIDTNGPNDARLKCLDSMIPVSEYRGQFLAPVAKIVSDTLICISPSSISIHES